MIGEEDGDQEFLFPGSDDHFRLSDLKGDSDALDEEQGKPQKTNAPVQQLQKYTCCQHYPIARSPSPEAPSNEMTPHMLP